MEVHNHLLLQFLGVQCSLWPLRAPCMHRLHRHAFRQNSHAHKMMMVTKMKKKMMMINNSNLGMPELSRIKKEEGGAEGSR